MGVVIFVFFSIGGIDCLELGFARGYTFGISIGVAKLIALHHTQERSLLAEQREGIEFLLNVFISK